MGMSETKVTITFTIDTDDVNNITDALKVVLEDMCMDFDIETDIVNE